MCVEKLLAFVIPEIVVWWRGNGQINDVWF